MSSGGGDFGQVLGGGASGATSGAAMGFMFGGPAGALTGAALGGGLGLMQGLAGASSAHAANDIAAAQLAQQRADRAQAMSILQPTQAQLQQLQEAMAVNSQQIKQGQQLLAATDPAIIQAAMQAQELLQGKESPVLSPVKNQRSQQRAQLESQLQAQLGSGYRTSSAGIQALNSFDQQTADLMATVQQNAIGQLMGFTTTGATMGAGMQQQGIANISGLTGQQYGFQQSQANALLGTPIDPGLQYTGRAMQAGAMGQNIQNIATMGALYGMSGGFRGAGTGVSGGGGVSGNVPSANMPTSPMGTRTAPQMP